MREIPAREILEFEIVFFFFFVLNTYVICKLYDK